MARRLTVEADGGSRGNPGVAGYGALVRDTETAALLAERAEPLGTASNNVAEYRGLIAGLQAAQAIDPGADIEARMDSKLVVEQMSGRWKIKHEDMRRLALEARDLAAQITDAGGSVRFTWIPRAENSAADALSNQAMDGETIDRIYGAALADSTIAPEASPQAQPNPAPAGASSSGFGPGRGVPSRVVLVRHGVTDFTTTGRLDGRGGEDPPLTAEGHRQAAAAARAVAHLVGSGPARVVTSSLTRAVETGAPIAAALGVAPEIDPDWDEQSFGDWDGRALRDLFTTETDAFRALRQDATYSRPGGESHEDLVARVVPAFERLLAPEGSTTIVVCHRKPILVVLAHLLGIDHDRAWQLAAAPGSLTAIEAWPNGAVSIAFTNRT
jgi:broad specificity phosphatase PhoE/ribonuclease HI